MHLNELTVYNSTQSLLAIFFLGSKKMGSTCPHDDFKNLPLCPLPCSAQVTASKAA
jgi:hypothetical protein